MARLARQLDTSDGATGSASRVKGATDSALGIVSRARKYLRRVTRSLDANKKGLFKVMVTVSFGAVAAYALQKQLLWVLFKPAGSQAFMSSPATTDYLPRLYLAAGLIFAAPAIFGQALRFIAPSKRSVVRRYAGRLKALASLFALLGLAYGYFIGLPSELVTLLPGFTSVAHQPTADMLAYLSFVAAYLLSATFILQVPLLLLIVNRTHVLKTKNLLLSLVWVAPAILAVTYIMNPAGRLGELRAVAVPLIVTYGVGMGVVWFVNRRPKRRAAKVLELLERDMSAQAERLRQAEEALLLPLNQPKRWVLMPIPADSAPSLDGPTEPVNEPTDEPADSPAGKMIVKPVSAPPEPPAKTALPKRDGRTDYRAAVVRPRQTRRLIM